MAERYLETEFLIAVMDGDNLRAAELLTRMLPGELRRFSVQLVVAQDMVIRARRIKAAAGLAERMRDGQAVAEPGPVTPET